MSAISLSGIGRRVRVGLCALGLSPWLAACVAADGARKVPLEVPFALDKGGEIVELLVSIPERRSYTFGIGFMVDRKIPEDAERVLALIGTAARDATGKYVDLGVPLKIRLEIESVKTRGPPYHFEMETSEIVLYAGPYEQEQKRITAVGLDPGTYRVKVTNLLAAPPMRGTPINFHIRHYRFGK
jgi:hypothetical protein